jgi:hypothetical protein
MVDSMSVRELIRRLTIPRRLWAPSDSGWWIAITFIVGSILFGFGAIFPLIPGFPFEIINVVYLVGSSLYLVGAGIQAVQGRRMKINDRGDAKDVRAFANRNSQGAFIQAFGAILFQTSMTGAFIRSLSIAQQEKIIWVPDLFGALCFLIASWMFFTLRYPIQHRQDNGRSARELAMMNIVGSAFFVISALGAYIVPLTDQAIYPRIANLGTLAGALLFLLSSIPGLPAKPSASTRVAPHGGA